MLKKNLKKLLGFTMATTLVVGSSLTVSAAGVEKQTSSGNVTVNASGVVSQVDTTVYSITLPTSNAFGDMIVDPQGLTQLSGNMTLDDLAEAGSAGVVKTQNVAEYLIISML